MPAVDLTDPATFPGALVYEHTDIPPGLTLEDWRRQRARQAREQGAARMAARREAVFALITLRAARSRIPGRAAARSRTVTS